MRAENSAVRVTEIFMRAAEKACPGRVDNPYVSAGFLTSLVK